MGAAHEPWLVWGSLLVVIQGADVGLSLAVQVLGEFARDAAAPAAGGGGRHIARRRHLVDALRRHARGRHCPS